MKIFQNKHNVFVYNYNFNNVTRYMYVLTKRIIPNSIFDLNTLKLNFLSFLFLFLKNV